MKFSKDSSKVLHLGRTTVLMIKSENGLSGDELCLRDGHSADMIHQCISICWVVSTGQ